MDRNLAFLAFGFYDHNFLDTHTQIKLANYHITCKTKPT